MKVILVLVLLFAASSARADQVVALCTQSSSGAFTNCVKVDATHPLPVYLPLGH